MNEVCPSCQAPALVVPGENVTCAECGHSWRVAPALPPAFEFELQRSRGDAVDGPFDRLTLREMLYTGRLRGQELVRIPGQTSFQPIAERPEFGEILHLLGKVSDEPQGERRITGWKTAKPAKTVADKAVSAPPTAPPPAAKKGVSPVLVVGALIVGAVVVLGALLALSAS